MRISDVCSRAAFFVSILICILASIAHAQRGVSVAPANLQYLTDRAETIVLGNVVSAVLEPHPQFQNIQTVVVTIAVAKTFKGPASRTLTFRQFVWDPRERLSPAGYHKTEELVLFLNPVSEYGLTSPVGMEQGQFHVLRDAKGNQYALNGRGNIGLFSGVLSSGTVNGVRLSAQARTMLSRPGGKVSLGSFEEVIQALVGGRQ